MRMLLQVIYPSIAHPKQLHRKGSSLYVDYDSVYTGVLIPMLHAKEALDRWGTYSAIQHLASSMGWKKVPSIIMKLSGPSSAILGETYLVHNANGQIIYLGANEQMGCTTVFSTGKVFRHVLMTIAARKAFSAMPIADVPDLAEIFGSNSPQMQVTMLAAFNDSLSNPAGILIIGSSELTNFSNLHFIDHAHASQLVPDYYK